MHLCLVTSRIPPTACGVGDYTFRLGQALEALGHRVSLITASDQAGSLEGTGITVRNSVRSWGLSGIGALLREARRLKPDRIVIEWVPYLYQHRGMNLALPLAALELRREGFDVETMVHEPWVPFDRPSRFVNGPVQRAALGILVCASRRVMVSIEAWTEMLAKLFPWKRKDIVWVPVGSNVPVAEGGSGVTAGAPVVAVFSPKGSGKDLASIERTWRLFPAARWVVIGEAGDSLAGMKCEFTGYLSSRDVSLQLRKSDVLLAPFVDGISTRRTSAIAALAHGVPVVTTRGELTDGIWERSPVKLCASDPMELAAALKECIGDAGLRERTRKFHDENFGWRGIAEKILG